MISAAIEHSKPTSGAHYCYPLVIYGVRVQPTSSRSSWRWSRFRAAHRRRRSSPRDLGDPGRQRPVRDRPRRGWSWWPSSRPRHEPGVSAAKGDEPAAGWRVALPGAGVRARAREPGRRPIAFTHDVEDPHVHVAERGQERGDPPPGCVGQARRVEILDHVQPASVQDVLHEPVDDLPMLHRHACLRPFSGMARGVHDERDISRHRAGHSDPVGSRPGACSGERPGGERPTVSGQEAPELASGSMATNPYGRSATDHSWRSFKLVLPISQRILPLESGRTARSPGSGLALRPWRGERCSRRGRTRRSEDCRPGVGRGWASCGRSDRR